MGTPTTVTAMRQTLTCIAGAAALAITLTACGDSGGGDKASDGCTPVASSVAVEALDKLQFDAESYEAGAGCVEVTYTNEGGVAHTLLIEDQPGFKLAIGDEDTGTVTLDAGTYTLYCDIAGHRDAGMEAELTVA